MGRVKKRIAILLSVVCITISFSMHTEATIKTLDNNWDAPQIGAEIGYVLEVNSGAVLYDKGGDTKAFPASITKIMTALIALRDGDLSETVTFSHEAVFSIPYGYSHIALDVGEKITLEQALYAALLPSANEACYGIAEHISGSLEAFTENMNETAKKLGATGTHFVNSNGIHDENHYTTAHDMALFMKEAIKYDKFREIISTRNYYIPPTNLKAERYILNTNETIKMDSKFYNEYVIGAKTGYTEPAGKTLVTYAKRGNIDLIVVIMKATATNVFEDTNTLINYFLADNATLATEDISDSDQILIPSNVNQVGFEKSVIANVKPASSITYYKFPNMESSYVKKVEAPDRITKPMKIGDKVGELVLYQGDIAVGRVDLIIDSYSIDEKEPSEEAIADVKDEMQDNKGKFTFLTLLKWALIVIVGAVVILFLYARYLDLKIRRRRRRRRSTPSWRQYK